MTTPAARPIMLFQQHVPVVIVGAGVAGLSCAGMLKQQQQPQQQQQLQQQNAVVDHHRCVAPPVVGTPSTLLVLLFEAKDRPGGRVWGRKKGAELIHGTQTALTKYLKVDHTTLRPIYIVSHADGGPTQVEPEEEDEISSSTRYGQWYMDGKLYRAYEHPDIMELRKVLDDASDSCQNDPTKSVLDVIPSHLHPLAKVSFGNTAGCTDLSQISASMLLHHFDTYWEQNEQAGDYFLDIDLVGRLVDDLSLSSSSSSSSSSSFQTQLQLRHRVNFIAPMNQEDVDSPLILDVIVSSGGEDIHDTPLEQTAIQIKADSVVVTVPPYLWPKIIHPSLLSDEKKRAIQYVGMEQAIKIVCRYQTPCWDPNLQQIICMDEPIPEVWFDDCTAVGFLMSEFASQFLTNNNNNSYDDDDDAAVMILTRQLSKMLQVPMDQFVALESSCTIWKDGGYMFPRVGMTKYDLEALASPSGKRLYFAGEATHTGACCTIQAAMETGYRAARSLLSSRQ